jgi:hypothetical protein
MKIEQEHDPSERHGSRAKELIRVKIGALR